MNKNIKTALKKIIILRMAQKVLEKTLSVRNGLGNKRKCYICGRTFNYFTKFRGGSRNRNEFRQRLDGVGSDADNFGCMFCGCHDRERHLFMFFDKLNLWEKMKHGKIIHFAPERHLQIRISDQKPDEYIKADLYPNDPDTRRIDATDIPFTDDTFDFLIANHILEHIPDYHKALSEFFRVIKPGGVAVLQTPYSKLLKNNFEDEGINSDDLRLFFHGQEDHVRTFGERQFFKSIEDAGFSLQIKKHGDYFDARIAYYYGVSMKEDLILAVKPAQIQELIEPCSNKEHNCITRKA